MFAKKLFFHLHKNSLLKRFNFQEKSALNSVPEESLKSEKRANFD
jgi:hypothetical protein